MIKYFLHDMLRDIAVDQDRSQSVTPLMGGQMDRLPVLVADVASFQPAVEGSPAGGAPVRPLEADAVVLGADHGAELVVDGHEGFAFHLGVAVAPAGGTGGAGGDAVPGKADGAGDPQ